MADWNGENAEKNYIEEATRIMERAKELQDQASSLNSKMRNEEQSLCQRVATIDSDIRRFKSSIEPALRNGIIEPRDAEKLEEEMYKVKCIISDGDISALLPSKVNGRFLKMFLGPINVRATRKDIQLKVKEEYNSFRDRTAILFILFPCILLLLKNWIWNGCFPTLPVQVYQVWLLYLYTCLALRENILRVNGSDIRPWWVYHHYCAMLMAVVSLTWEIKGQPNCEEKQWAVHLFLLWAVLQGVVMLLQNRYQRQRLYTRIALGKARRMDVVGGETAAVEGQLLLLYPILIILQISEGLLGVMLLKTALVGVISEWQVVVCGILLVLMAVGNFVNTWQTFKKKYRHKTKMREAKACKT